MAADGECPARKALEYIERWAANQNCSCITHAEPTVVCGRCVSLAKARSALSVPCPADQLRAETLESLNTATAALIKAASVMDAKDAELRRMEADLAEALEVKS